ncbi:MAG: phasin family protein [Elainellaceae cyanobacterium]
MAGLGDLVQKAFYLGVGIASYAGERAGKTVGELRAQAQKIADEMVERGEMTTEEAKRMVDEMVRRAQQAPDGSVTVDVKAEVPSSEPRRIEILDDDDATTTSSATGASQTPPASEPKASSANDDLRQQVAKLQEELRRLRNQ